MKSVPCANGSDDPGTLLRFNLHHFAGLLCPGVQPRDTDSLASDACRHSDSPASDACRHSVTGANIAEHEFLQPGILLELHQFLKEESCSVTIDLITAGV